MPSRKETPYTFRPGIFCGEFNRGRAYTNRRANGTPDWLLIYTLRGSGRITTNTGIMTTQVGDIILYAPGDQHDYATDPATGRWHLLWVHFTPKPMWRPWLNWPLASNGVRKIHPEKGEARTSFVAAMRRMLNISSRKLPNSAEFLSNALEEVLLWGHTTATPDPWLRTDLRVRKAMNYLATNLRSPFQLDQLARHHNLSISRLSHLFKKETGLSPQQFFEQQRMEQAAQLLRLTGLRVSEIAEEVGYDDAFYFSNRFHRYAKKSPTQFRNQTVQRGRSG